MPKSIKIIVGLMTLVALGKVVYPIIVFVVMFSNGGFLMIPQDCLASSIVVSGQVVDEHNRPIAGARITVLDEGGYFEFHLTSDTNGSFSSEATHAFPCFAYTVEVAAEGYLTNKRTLFQFQPIEGRDFELPGKLIIQLEPLDSGSS